MPFKEIQDAFAGAQEKYYERISNVNAFINRFSDEVKEQLKITSEVVVEDKVHYNEDTNTWDIKIIVKLEPKNPVNNICVILKIPFSKSVEKINGGVKEIVMDIEKKVNELISSDTFFVANKKCFEYPI
jgi:transcriptional accessory protein Tex/SPT6